MSRRTIIPVTATALVLLAVAAWWGTRPADAPVDATTERPPGVVPTDESPAEVTDGPQEDPPLQLELSTMGISIHNADGGRLLDHALLRVEATSGRLVSMEESVGGRWQITSVKGEVLHFIALADGFVPSERWRTAGDAPEFEFHLAETETVGIRVVDDRDGKPVPGAWVFVCGEPMLFQGRNIAAQWKGRTDRVGFVSCPEGGSVRRLTITASAPGYALDSREVISGYGEWTTSLRPRSTKGPFVQRVSVRDADGEAIQDAIVSPLSQSGRHLLLPNHRWRSNSEGEVVVELPGAAALSLPCLVTAPGMRPELIRMTGYNQVARLVQFQPHRLRVSDAEGKPAQGVPVAVHPHSVRGVPLAMLIPPRVVHTGGDGVALFPAVPPGTLVHVSLGGVSGRGLHRDLIQIGHSDETRWVMPSATSIAIESYRPGSLCFLYPWRSPKSAPVALSTVRPNLLVAGDDGIARALREDGLPLTATCIDGPLLWGSAVVQGSEPEGAVSLRPSRHVRVRAVDSEGRGVAGAVVRLEPVLDDSLPASLASRFLQAAVTGPDGTVLLEAPSDLPLTVQVARAGVLDTVRTVSAGTAAARVTIELPTGSATHWVQLMGDQGLLKNKIVHIVRGRGSHLPVRYAATDDRGLVAVRQLQGEARRHVLLVVPGLSGGAALLRFSDLARQPRVTVPQLVPFSLTVQSHHAAPAKFTYTETLGGGLEDPRSGTVGETLESVGLQNLNVWFYGKGLVSEHFRLDLGRHAVLDERPHVSLQIPVQAIDLYNSDRKRPILAVFVAESGASFDAWNSRTRKEQRASRTLIASRVLVSSERPRLLFVSRRDSDRSSSGLNHAKEGAILTVAPGIDTYTWNGKDWSYGRPDTEE